MTSQPPNEPAFPCPTVMLTGLRDMAPEIVYGAQGMTLLDYFAGQCMPALWHPDTLKVIVASYPQWATLGTDVLIARLAYAQAHAMLEVQAVRFTKVDPKQQIGKAGSDPA